MADTPQALLKVRQAAEEESTGAGGLLRAQGAGHTGLETGCHALPTNHHHCCILIPSNENKH